MNWRSAADSTWEAGTLPKPWSGQRSGKTRSGKSLHDVLENVPNTQKMVVDANGAVFTPNKADLLKNRFVVMESCVHVPMLLHLLNKEAALFPKRVDMLCWQKWE